MKKKIKTLSFFFILIFLFFGCQTTESLTNKEKKIITLAIDFREYSDKGFLFMPDEYFGDYEVLGIISAELHPKITYQPRHLPPGSDYLVTHFYHKGEPYSQAISIEKQSELIDYIYNLSIEWGGDAFSHFKSSIEVANTDLISGSSYYYYKISGVVIKRK